MLEQNEKTTCYIVGSDLRSLLDDCRRYANFLRLSVPRRRGAHNATLFSVFEMKKYAECLNERGDFSCP